MPSDVVIDGARCLERIRKLYALWHVSKPIDRIETIIDIPILFRIPIMKMKVKFQPMIIIHYILLMQLLLFVDKKKKILLIVKLLLFKLVFIQ